MPRVFGYDALARLTSASYPNGDATGYAFDGVGNRASSTLNGVKTTNTFNAADELTQSGSTSFTYDSNGNELTKTAAGVTTTYAYDLLNRLTSLSGPVTGSYAYNGDGLRVGKTVGGTTTSYAWDPTGIGTVLSDGAEYVWGQGLVSQVTSSSTTYAHGDGLGSIRLLTDASGNPIGTAQYDAYGASRASTGTQLPFGFTGEQQDSESGLIYLRARYYDPGTGRFLTPDSAKGALTAPQSLNRYTYALGQPTDLTDPSGHDATDAVDGAWARVGAAWRRVGRAQRDVEAAGDAVDASFDSGGQIESSIAAINQATDQVDADLAGLVGAALNGDPAAIATAFANTVRAYGSAYSSMLAATMAMVAGYGRVGAAYGNVLSSYRDLLSAYVDLISSVAGLVGALAAQACQSPGIQGQSIGDLVQAAARRAVATVGPGSGPAYGTRVHRAFEDEVRSLRAGGLPVSPEQSYLNGQRVSRGTPGAVRLEVVERDPDHPTAIYDLKTGSAGLTADRIAEIRRNLPQGSRNVPIVEISP